MTLLVLGIMAWSAGLVLFMQAMPTETVPATEKAEMLVVLTGGSDRVEHGLAMLAEGAAPVLLISGVGERVTEERIVSEHASAAVREKIYERGGIIILDRVARSTISNADQSAAIIKRHGVHRIRLITANYHMQRSLHEFHDANPDLEIIPDPVFPTNFRRDEWWYHNNTRRLVFSEFYKYIAVLLRDEVKPN